MTETMEAADRSRLGTQKWTSAHNSGRLRSSGRLTDVCAPYHPAATLPSFANAPNRLFGNVFPAVAADRDIDVYLPDLLHIGLELFRAAPQSGREDILRRLQQVRDDRHSSPYDRLRDPLRSLGRAAEEQH